MMDHQREHHHHHQELLLLHHLHGSSNYLVSASAAAAAASASHPLHHLQYSHASNNLDQQQWCQNFFLNGSSSLIPADINGMVYHSKDQQPAAAMICSSSPVLTQDLGFEWGSNTNIANAETSMNHLTSSDVQQIKEENKLSDHSTSTIDQQDLITTKPTLHDHQNFHGLDDQLSMISNLRLLAGSSCSDLLMFNNTSLAACDHQVPVCGKGNFSTFFPTTDVPSLNNHLPMTSLLLQSSSSSMEHIHGLDMLSNNPARVGLDRDHSQHNNTTIALSLLQDRTAACGLGHIHEVNQATNHLKVSSAVKNGVSGVVKRSNSMLEQKASQAPCKKPRAESRSSISPFKVRKEKLGDRIAALQQLVAPFGKTDTASVLTEAIGYIKFLQDQIETLSVPYLRSSSNKKLKTSEAESYSSGNKEGDEPKLDLISRGLCLVPLSCTSYVTNDNGGLWSSASSFRGSGT